MSDSIKLKSNWKSITFVTALASIFMLNVTEANGEIRGIDGINLFETTVELQLDAKGDLEEVWRLLGMDMSVFKYTPFTDGYFTSFMLIEEDGIGLVSIGGYKNFSSIADCLESDQHLFSEVKKLNVNASYKRNSKKFYQVYWHDPDAEFPVSGGCSVTDGEAIQEFSIESGEYLRSLE